MLATASQINDIISLCKELDCDPAYFTQADMTYEQASETIRDLQDELQKRTYISYLADSERREIIYRY